MGAQMQWSNTFQIGIPAIDAQHKRLFELVNELSEALQSGLRGKDVAKLLAALDQYKTRHFQLEEKYMKESDYPGLAEQQQAHSYFTRRFSQLHDELNSAGLGPAIVRTIKQELSDWITEHVTSLDMQFGKYYQERDRG